jgi:hypothetical protein
VRDQMSDNESKPQSKFEWRPEDITILSKEEGDAAEAEYNEWLAEMDRETSGEYAEPSSGVVDSLPTVPKEPN